MTRPMDDDELTEEREVAVLEHRHLPERLQQLSTGAACQSGPMSGVKVKPTNSWWVDRGTYVPGEVLRAALVTGLAAHGDELVVDAGLLERQQSPRHERRESPPVHLHRRRSHDFLAQRVLP